MTEFVDNLKKELDATSREEISIYFDINPNDGLLDTHDVNASIEEKIKALVLFLFFHIPIAIQKATHGNTSSKLSYNFPLLTAWD